MAVSKSMVSTRSLSPKQAQLNRWVISLALVVLSLAIYWPVVSFNFINYDDPVYITQNPNVLHGPTSEGVKWAFKSLNYASNWHPLTWLSHMLDVKLFGLNAGWHHMVNAMLHTVSTVLLFSALNAATGSIWASAFTAGLFTLHPLHVESVAWVSERKDVLSSFFWMLGMLAYIRYVRAPGVVRYLLVFVAFVMGLMAKPMVVAFPFVLLIMDYWPLGRFAHVPYISSCGGIRARFPFHPVIEKMPLVVFSAASGVITYLAQGQGGSISLKHGQHLDLRLANASLAYIHYLIKTVWPLKLSVYYPYNFGWSPTWKYAGATAILVAISTLAIWWRRRHPSLLAGWLWFIGVLVPTIGFVQVGTQAVADRYTYIPLIGLFMAVSYGISRFWPHQKWARLIAWAMVGIVLCILIVLSSIQVRYWRDSGSLFVHAVEINPNDIKVRDNLGSFLLDNGRLEEAIAHFSQSVKISPIDYMAWFNLGLARCRQGNASDARIYFRKAISIHPAFSQFYDSLGRPCAEH